MNAPTQAPTSEVSRILDQLRRAYDEGAWHGPSLRQLVGDVNAEQAGKRVLPHVHTIHELVLHITAWMRIARERLSATEIRDETPEENWPQAKASWDETLASLETEQRALEAAILKFPDSRLSAPAPAREPQTFYVLLHGIVQHNLYHAGQIAILKK